MISLGSWLIACCKFAPTLARQMWRHKYVIGRNEYLIFTLSESINPWVYSLQFLFKSTNNSWRYKRKCEWVFFSEHSVLTYLFDGNCRIFYYNSMRAPVWKKNLCLGLFSNQALPDTTAGCSAHAPVRGIEVYVWPHNRRRFPGCLLTTPPLKAIPVRALSTLAQILWSRWRQFV